MYTNMYKAKGDMNGIVVPQSEVPVSINRKESNMDANNVIPRHKHNFFEIVYITKGNAIHILEGKPCILMPGDVFAVIPGEYHQFISLRNTVKYDCLFTPEVINDFPPSITSLNFIGDLLKGIRHKDITKINLPIIYRDGIKELFDKMIVELYSYSNESPALTVAYLVEALVNISRGAREFRNTTENSENAYTKTILEVVSYIEENFKEKLTVNSIAATASMSCDYFSRVFHKHTGMTPSEYIQMLRISKAVELLYEKEYTISDIAYDSGFADRIYFSRTFKKITGKTPSEYRNMICK